MGVGIVVNNGTETDCIRVLICDPRHLIRVGLASVLTRESDISVVGEALHTREVAEAIDTLRPHVALINHDPDDMNAITIANILREKSHETVPGILMLSSKADYGDLLSVLQGGIRGLLPENCDPQSVPAAIRDVAGGAMVMKLQPAVQLISQLIQRSPALAAAPSSRLALLTSRERDVLSLVADGNSNQLIAERLTLSEATVKSHLYHLCQKLGLRDRTQAVILAYETGLVRPCLV
ncbi:response regulator transcription factor [Streptomyces avermitilis]|uniref:response regulator transcription factor n=1 Tax=Streptomyces avermitilis TaxID=33903 RepID=UPI0033EA0374